MRKQIALFILVASILCLLPVFPSLAAAAQDSVVDVLFDSRFYAMQDQLLRTPLFSYRGEIYVPLQGIFESMYQTFTWDEAAQTATVTDNSDRTAELERIAEQWTYPTPPGRGSYHADYVSIVEFDAETGSLVCAGSEEYRFTLTEQEKEQVQEMLHNGLAENSKYRLTVFKPWPLGTGPISEEESARRYAPRFVELSPSYSEVRQAVVRPISVYMTNGDGMGNPVLLPMDALECDGLLYISINVLDEPLHWFSYGLIVTDYADEPPPDQHPPVIAPDVRLILDSEALRFDVPILMANDRLLVPLRAIFEAMGADVAYDSGTKTVTATKGETVVVLIIGDRSPTINGQIVSIDQPGLIADSRTMAPLRFVAEAFGGAVVWDPISRIAAIWMGEPEPDTIFGEWEYVRSTEGDEETPLVLHELELSPPRLEIGEDDTFTAFFYESRREGTITRPSQYAWYITYTIVESEGYQYHPDLNDSLAYDPISKLLRYTFNIADVHHYFKRK